MSAESKNPDLLEQRRRRGWRRHPHVLSVGSPIEIHGKAPHSIPLGYPVQHPVLRALLPATLAILLMLVNTCSRSTISEPRDQTRSEHLLP